MRNLFVITGGPGAGKTTLLHQLQKLGFPCVPEVARQIIQEEIQSGGTALPWADRERYTNLMLQRSIDSYRQHASTPGPTFFDRGIPDTLSYARLIGLPDTAPLKGACEQLRYAEQVFIAPPWKEIYQTDTERRQDFSEAERTFQVILQTYQDCCYHVVELPKLSSNLRARFVLQTLGLTPADFHRTTSIY
jgi:predicted ATPase